MASSSGKALENSSPSSTPRRMFSLRVVNLDYYMAPPLPGMDVCYSEFQGRGVREVPVVRIFGSTTSGQKTCLHLHKAFPYFYVPYGSELPQEVNEALGFVRSLASSIEKAMKMASTVGAKRQHLHSCSLVRGKKYYGYHPNEQLFIKIVLYYPQEVSRVSTLLLSGGIMNHTFEPHEAHFPYLLQILIDHNLFGMGHLHLSSLKFRNPLPEARSDLKALVKRVKRDFSDQEAIPQVEVAAVDPSKDYSSLKENLRKEKAMSNSPLSPQPMKETPSKSTVGPLSASTSCSPAFRQIAMKEEILSTLPPKFFPTVKEEPLDTLPPDQSSSPVLHLTTKKEETLSTLPPSKLLSHRMREEDTPSTLPGQKSSSPAIYQMTPDGGSKPEMWLQKSIPGDWIWPLLASDNIENAVHGQGLYSRQSTCELEADASVEDILNRGELRFLPMQQAGPDIKMVQSLTPMWEEERVRSGEGGPAGSIDPLYQPTARTVPIPSPFEEAMRDTLFQIARAEEHDLGAKYGSQSSTEKSDPESGVEPVLEICTLLGSQQELKISIGSAGISAAASDEDEVDERQQSSVPFEVDPHTRPDSCLESTQTGHDLAIAINEEVIRKQLSQKCLSQDLDKEVAEFLRWMGTTQLDMDEQEYGNPDSKDGEMNQMVLSQMFSSPGMDAALLKALADYENATEQECQAILDCADIMDEEEEDVVDHNDLNEYSRGPAQVEGNESEKAQRSPGYRLQSRESPGKKTGKRAPPDIPQTDGVGDEDERESEGDRSLQSFSSKRPRHDRKDWLASATSKNATSRSGLQELSNHQKREVSLRDMMRKRRERKPGKKEGYPPSSLILEDVSSEIEPDCPKDNEGKLLRPEVEHQRLTERNLPQDQKIHVVFGEDSPQNEDLLATTKKGVSLERHLAFRKKGKVIQKSDNVNNMLTSKFGTLPVVTLKYDSADVNCHVEQLLEKYSEEGFGTSLRESQGVTEHKDKVDLPLESSSRKSCGKKLIPKEVTSREYITTMQSRGDDRDCGGGETSFGLDHDSLIEPAPDRILEVYVNSPPRDTTVEMVEVHPREPDGNLADYKPEVDSGDDDDFFVAQTQFRVITVPQSPQSSQRLSEAGDSEKLDKVDILPQSREAVMMSQVPNLAVPQLTSQNRTDPYVKREEQVILDRSFQDSDCLRLTQVVKPDVSYMTGVRPGQFEKYGDNVRVEIQAKDVISAEQTQILGPFIPFLDSRDPRDCPHDDIVDIEETGIANEHDEVAGQTQILELDNLHFRQMPQTMLTEYVRDLKESDIADDIAQVLEQTQVLNLEEPQMINSDQRKSGVFQVKVGERDVAGDDVQIEWSTRVLDFCSSQYRELRRGEIGGFVEGMEGQGSLDESGDPYEQTPKLDRDRAKYVAGVREDYTPEESQGDFGAQTQILTPEEVFPSTPDRGTTLEAFTNRKVDEISDNHIRKVVEAELISTPSPVLPFGTTEIPSKVELFPCLHGERESRVGVSSSSAYATQNCDGLNHRQNNQTQYIFCDMSDDSEASYDSDQDRWWRHEGVSTSALFEDQEIGESGSRCCEDYQLEEGCLTMGRESGWDDGVENTHEAKSSPSFEDKSHDQSLEEIGRPSGAGEHIGRRDGRLCKGNSWDDASKDADEKFLSPVSEAQKKVQDVEQMEGQSAADEDAENVGCLQPRGLHPTQYLFTDMSDDSEASYDSGTDGRELSWNAAEDYFSGEEKEGGNPCAAEDERSFGLRTERKSGIRMAETEVQGGMSEEQNGRETIVQNSLVLDVYAGKDGQKSDLILAENCDRKYDPESPCPPLSSLKFPNRLENGASRRSEIISGPVSTGRAPLCLSGSSLESFHPDFGNKSASTKPVSSHVSKGDVKPSVVPWLDSTEDEDSEVMMEESTLQVFCENSSQAREIGGKAYVGKDAEDIPHQTQSQTVFVASRDVTQWNFALVPFSTLKLDEQLMPLIFHQRPPTRDRITESFKKIACNYKADDIFYGNAKDVSDHPVVRAGLVFDVKSREAIHLRPFQFGISSRRSNFDPGSKHRVYVQQESWGCEERVDIGAGIPTYIENDGTKLYIITPARAPPSPRAVKEWLSLQSVQHIEASNRTLTGGQQIFTMDPNTGKLVPVSEIGSVANTQESNPKTNSSQEDGEFVRPASPQYDERHVFFFSHSSTTSASHGVSHSRSATKYGDLSVNISSASAVAERGRPCSPGLASLAPCSAQTSRSQATSLVNINDGKEMPQNNSGSALPLDWRVEALLKRKLDGNAATKAGKHWRDVSQMTALTTATTPLSQSGFRDPASSGLGQQITLMSIEVFSETRGDLLPDPRYDAVGCIVLVLHEDDGRSGNTDITVVLIRDKEAHSSRRYPDGIQGCELIYLPDEKALFRCFAQLVRLCDPDMLVGWEVQGFSLGLLAERAANLGISLLKQLSRIPPVSTASSELLDKEVGGDDQPEAALFDKVHLETIGVDEPIIDDEWGRTHGSGLYIGGRTVLNAWRIMRGEVKLNIYSIEAVAEAVLRRRVPRLPWQTLTTCFVRGPSGGRYHCIEYFINRARLTLEIMEQLDLVNRTAELARVFGIDFYSVFSRGSQFRVESMMARLAHTQNYLLVSPTRQQVAEQPGMQCLPLVMEPESRFYNSPVIVLDFQSLYPSMIIAYNLCFSTCLGKLSAENPKVLGVTKLKLDPGTLSRLKESMTITPNGIMFAPKEVLPGVLPRLLQEILSTRIMIKKAMKALTPEQRVLERVLNARQFALKLIANVTYGYTAAGFSGRMPCAEIADSIVQCGRLTLERAINMVNSNPRWNARVVYGDTDSMFVLCEGRSKDEAFKIGQEIAASVTETNPPPVTLKLEKVYLPCVLLTKKRYVGYSFESPSQVKPIFDAKGIETIRRDTCPAVAKALEHSLRLLFETQDLSQVKQYLQRQWGKILSGRISIQDFVFAKEVRLGTYSARSPVLPPAAIVASKAMAVDPRAEPRYAERIPYVVVHGEPGARLVDMVVDPLTLITQSSLRLHDTYYITKQIIPACQRIFMLVGVDLRAWFSEMPRVYRPPTSKRVSNLAMGAKSTRWDPDAGKFKRNRSLRHGTIDQYFLSRHCTVCGEFTRASQLLCSKCIASPRAAAVLLPGRTSRLEKEYKHLEAICRQCGGGDSSLEGNIACISLDCPVFFERRKVHRELIAAGAVSSDLGYYPPCLPELY